MKTRFWIFLAASGAVWAQQVVAPTTEMLGTRRGEDHGSYNITNSFETGYRFSLVGGDLGEYRSDVTYSNGLRLLGSSVSNRGLLDSGLRCNGAEHSVRKHESPAPRPGGVGAEKVSG